ncbi:MAG TPA: hypothetical protein DHU62_00430 [Firmicutes bacterium]|nr:hypothetical protein [Bacillota bacterium]
MKSSRALVLVPLILFLSCPIAKVQSGSCSLKTSIKRQENTSNVLNDLTKLSIDLTKYSTASTAEMITLAESESGQIFVYIFDKNVKYDSIDISYSFDPASERFSKYKLTQVDTESNITKYLVNNLKSDMTLKKRRYAIRQVYDSKSKNKIDGIIPVALEYLLETDTNNVTKMKVNTLDKVVVTSKLVAYEMLKNGVSDSIWFTNQNSINKDVVKTGYNYIKNNIAVNGNPNIYHYIQSNYIAFNTNIDITDIVDVTINCDYNIFQGNTIHGDNMTTDYPLTNIDLTRKSFVESSKYYEVTQYLNKTIEVKPENINYSYIENNFFSFKKVVSSFSTIQKVSDLENKTDAVNGYTWLVRFGNNDVLSRGTYTDILTTRHFVYNYYDYSNVSLMTLHYVKNGDIKQAVFIDTYEDSDGNVPVENPEEDLNFFERILRAFKRVFTNKDVEFVDYFYFGVGLVGSIVILVVLVKLIKLLIKLF